MPKLSESERLQRAVRDNAAAVRQLTRTIRLLVEKLESGSNFFAQVPPPFKVSVAGGVSRDDVFVAGPLIIDLKQYTLEANGKTTLPVPSQIFRLLCFFAEHADIWVRADEIQKEFWGGLNINDPSQSMRSAIHKLKQVLAEVGCEHMFESVQKRTASYRLNTNTKM